MNIASSRLLVSAIFCFLFALTSPAQSGPNITQVEQNPVSAGGSLCFDGSGFGADQGTSTVTVNGVSAPVLWWVATRACISVGSNTTLGTAALQVVTSAASSNVFSFVVTGQPTVSGINPSSGPVGTQVTLSGANFGAQQYDTSYVQYNSHNVPVVSWSDTAVVVSIPSGTPLGSSLFQVVVGTETTCCLRRC